jgi:hypothetical protein
MVLYRRRLDALSQTEVPGTLNPGVVQYGPDGRSLLMEELGGSTLYRVPLDGGQRVRLANVVGGSSWGAEEFVVYARDLALWRVAANGGTPSQLTRPDSQEVHSLPHVLPGGDALLFNVRSRLRERTREETEVWVLRLRDGSRVRLALTGINPRYIPTGHILVTGADGALFVAPFIFDRSSCAGRQCQFSREPWSPARAPRSTMSHAMACSRTSRVGVP